MNMGRPPLNLAQDAAFKSAPLMKPPSYMTREQRRTWKQILEANRHLNKEAMREPLETYVLAIDRQRRAEQIQQEEGIVLNGKPHPAATIANAAAGTIASMTVKLGIALSTKRTPVPKSEETCEAPKKRGGALPFRLA